MGVYINPENCSKLDWLKENAIEVTRKDIEEHSDFEVVLPLVLFDNVVFHALAIAYKQEEKNYFLELSMDRPGKYTFWMVERMKLPIHCLELLNSYQGK
jgi:hypothetical protein